MTKLDPVSGAQGVVMVIDPDAYQGREIETILAKTRFTTLTALDIDDANVLLEHQTPTVVLLDEAIARPNGWAFLRWLRAETAAAIAVLVAYAEGDGVIEALEGGADMVIARPLRSYELRARVETLARRAEHPVAVPAPEPVPVTVAAPVAAPYIPYVPAPEPYPAVEPLPAVEQVPVAQVEPVLAQVYEFTARPDQGVPVVAEPAPAGAPVESADLVEPVDLVEQAEVIEAVEAEPELVETSPEPVTPEPVTPEPAAPREVGPVVELTAEWETFRALSIQRQTRQIAVAGRQVTLDDDEFDLVSTVLASGRNVRSRADLAGVLRGSPAVALTPDERAQVDNVMASALKKLGQDPAQPEWIEGIPGVGYRRASLTSARR